MSDGMPDFFLDTGLRTNWTLGDEARRIILAEYMNSCAGGIHGPSLFTFIACGATLGDLWPSAGEIDNLSGGKWGTPRCQECDQFPDFLRLAETPHGNFARDFPASRRVVDESRTWVIGFAV